MVGTDIITGELVPTAGTPAPTPELAAEAMRLYQEISRALLTADDMTRIGRKEFPNRSAFQKLGNAYRVSTKIVRDEDDYDPDGRLVRSKITVRATHPDGREAEGDGRCHIQEKGSAANDPKSEHDVHGTAVTRATNRAISNLVAFGAVSAEEIGEDGQVLEHGPQASQRELTGLERALHDLYGSDELLPVLERLDRDAGGYTPRIVARAVMLVAAHRPTPTNPGMPPMEGGGTSVDDQPQSTPDPSAGNTPDNTEVTASSAEGPPDDDRAI